MSTFKEAFADLATMLSDNKKRTHLSENTLLDLMKTQLVYGAQHITSAPEDPPVHETITGDPTEFTEDTDEDRTGPGDDPRLN